MTLSRMQLLYQVMITNILNTATNEPVSVDKLNIVAILPNVSFYSKYLNNYSHETVHCHGRHVKIFNMIFSWKYTDKTLMFIILLNDKYLD